MEINDTSCFYAPDMNAGLTFFAIYCYSRQTTNKHPTSSAIYIFHVLSYFCCIPFAVVIIYLYSFLYAKMKKNRGVNFLISLQCEIPPRIPPNFCFFFLLLFLLFVPSFVRNIHSIKGPPWIAFFASMNIIYALNQFTLVLAGPYRTLTWILMITVSSCTDFFAIY